VSAKRSTFSLVQMKIVIFAYILHGKENRKPTNLVKKFEKIVKYFLSVEGGWPEVAPCIRTD